VNLFNYVGANPVNRTDPEGLQADAIPWPVVIPDVTPLLPVLVNPITVGIGVGLVGVLWPSELSDDNACKTGKWTCTATCHETPYGGVSRNQRIISSMGRGSTQSLACQDAIANCRASAARGTYTRHCQCPECWRN
jgi:hypothetical protein